MAGREIAVKKYVVRLSAEERDQLGALISRGKSSTQLLTRARILLKADVSEAGEGWSDSAISAALDTSINNVARTRQLFVEDGFEAPGMIAGEVFAVGDTKGDAGLPDFVFRADETLSHGCRRHEEGGGDGCRVEAEDNLQHERRADAGFDGWVGAGEHQGEAAIGNLCVALGVGRGKNFSHGLQFL